MKRNNEKIIINNAKVIYIYHYTYIYINVNRKQEKSIENNKKHDKL